MAVYFWPIILLIILAKWFSNTGRGASHTVQDFRFGFSLVRMVPTDNSVNQIIFFLFFINY